MDKYPRTYLGALLLITVLLIGTGIPASAQSRNQATNSPQATLQIRVHIVSTLRAAPTPVEPKKQLIGSVAYDISVDKSNVDVMEETHPLFIRNVAGSEGLEGAILKTLTIVPH